MGIDLIGCGRSYNWTGWDNLYETGIKYGWKPKGTLAPEDFDGEWSGTYFSNDYQRVSADDALAWAQAIERYLADLHAESPPEPDSSTRRAALIEVDREWYRQWYADFARLASEGEFMLG